MEHDSITQQRGGRDKRPPRSISTTPRGSPRLHTGVTTARWHTSDEDRSTDLTIDFETDDTQNMKTAGAAESAAHGAVKKTSHATGRHL